MKRTIARTLLVACLLSSTLNLSGCISHTTVYEDEDAHTAPKPSKPAPTSKTTNKQTSSTTKEPTVIKHERHFYYYPSCEVYRDCETQLWFWEEGDAWQVSSSLPKAKKIGREKPLLIIVDGEHPGHHHRKAKNSNTSNATHSAETHKVKKSLPAHANGRAKGHDKQNQNSEAEAVQDAAEISALIETDPPTQTSNVEAQVVQPVSDDIPVGEDEVPDSQSDKKKDNKDEKGDKKDNKSKKDKSKKKDEKVKNGQRETKD